jgi:hypothetical protein
VVRFCSECKRAAGGSDCSMGLRATRACDQDQPQPRIRRMRDYGMERQSAVQCRVLKGVLMLQMTNLPLCRRLLRCRRNCQAHARPASLFIVRGIAVLNLTALPVMLAFIATVTGFRE